MHLLPPGEPLAGGFSLIRGRDGREFLAPPFEALVAAFKEPIPIDINHGTQRAEGFAARAVGWIESLEATAEGLFGIVRWLDEGRSMVESLQFRNQSPALRIGENGLVEGIVAAGLTNAPNLDLVALASEDPTMATPPPLSGNIQLCSKLGIPVDSDVSTILASARDGYVLETALNSVQAELKAEKAAASDARTELAARDKAAFEQKKEAVIGLAVKDGRCQPGEKDDMLALCSSEDGLKTVEAMLAKREPNKVVSENSQAPTGTPGSGDTRSRLALLQGMSLETWNKHGPYRNGAAS